MGARSSTRVTVGEMLYDDFEPYKEIEGELLSVYAAEDSSWIALNFEWGGSLTYTALANDDTLIWRDGQREFSGIDLTNVTPWCDVIGKSMPCAWLMMNRKGYIDGALLSFNDAALPSIALNVVASAIKVSVCGDWSEVSAP